MKPANPDRNYMESFVVLQDTPPIENLEQLKSYVESLNAGYLLYEQPRRSFDRSRNRGCWILGFIERGIISSDDIYKMSLLLCKVDGYRPLVEIDPQYMAW